MAQSPIYAFAGLHTNNSDISGAPPGSLRQAMNIDSSKLNLPQCRRGYDLLTAFSDSSYRATKVWDYQDYLYAYFNATVYSYASGTWTSKGALTKPTNALVPRPVFANNNLYIMSSSGLKKTDAYATSLFTAGLAAGVATVLTASTATGTGVATAKTVNYRWLIAKKDANNNLIQGPVCSGTSYSNASGATKDVCVLGYLPSSLAGTETVQVYRSQALTAVSDELQLVYEYPLNASNVAAVVVSVTSADTGTEVLTAAAHGYQDGTVVQVVLGTLVGPSASTNYVIDSATTNTFKLKTLAGAVVNITTSGTATVTSQVAFGIFDIVPDALLGTTLYTSPSQNGISQNNTRPPLSVDMTVYKDFMFYADTVSKQLFNFAIIAADYAGTYGGITNGTTITISGEVYTGAAAAVYGSGSGSFVVSSSGSVASASTRVDETARSLVDVINRSSLLVTATLVYTDSNSLPGKILLEARSLGASAFTVASTKQSAFSPQLPSTATSLTTSAADTYRNGLMFSRQGLPEATPAANLFRVGTASDPIVRILALRDALLIFKRKDGTFILRGENQGSFSIQPLDSTAKIVAGESLVILNGLIYGLFEAGICSVSDTSVEVISEQVKNKIQALYGTALQQVKDYAFGVAYESDNKYILALPTSSSSTYSTYQLIYNLNSGSYDEWDLEIGSGYMSSNDQKLYLGSGSSAYVKSERKDFDFTDFCDYIGVKQISSVDATGLILTILTGIDDFSIGDLLEQGTDDLGAYVTAVDTTGSTVTVDYVRDWTTGVNTVDHYQGIPVTIEWNPVFGDNPSGYKHFSECILLFKQALIRDAVITFSSDTTPSASTVEISGGDAPSAWGAGSWGEFPWGGESVPEPFRVGVPRDVARCNALSVTFAHQVAQSDFQLEGLALKFEPLSTRVAR